MTTSALAPDNGLLVEIINERKTFDALQFDWNSLVEHLEHPSVFLTHEWFQSALEWLNDTHRLHVLVVREAGRLVGALPLVQPQRRSFGPNVLEYLAVPDTQLCDVICGAGERERVIGAALKALAACAWDVLEIRHLPAHSPTLAALTGVLAAARFPTTTDASTRNAYIDLRGDWQTYYGSRSRRMKKRNNHSANRLKKLGETAIEWTTRESIGTTDVDALVDVLSDISGRSWKETTDNGLDKEAPRRFIRALTHHAHRRGWLSAWILKVADAPVAMEYQLAADGRIYALRSDFDLAFEDASPGTFLNWKILERTFGTGPTQYLMGPGDNPYKWQLTDDAETLVRLRVYNRSLRGRAIGHWERTLRPMLRRLRSAAERAHASKTDAQQDKTPTPDAAAD